MPGIGIGVSNVFRGVGILSITPPTNLTASFDIPTISGQVSWVDNSGGSAQYEVYSSYNGNPYVFLGTTLAGATSYIDTTCKQNASVVYRIRAKKGGTYSEYATTSAINTPLCWKTNQSTLSNVVINSLNIATGKTVNIDYGDGTSVNYTGNNSSVTKNYGSIGIYNIALSGDLNDITSLRVLSSSNIYSDISNYVIPTSCITFVLQGTLFTGNIYNTIFSTNFSTLFISDTSVSGFIPQCLFTKGTFRNSKYEGTYISEFNISMNVFDISNQNVVFPTIEVDKFFKNAADWYQVNPPTDNCTYNFSGANMGIPTGGVANVDIARLIQIYTDAGRTATVLVRTT